MLISGTPQGNRTALQRPVSWGQEECCLVCICRQASWFGRWGAQVKHTSMDNEEAMETNYFTTSESQDSGTKFLLPLLLFWNIIDVTAQSSHPQNMGKTRGQTCTVSNLLLRYQKRHKTIWTMCCQVPILFQIGSNTNRLPLHSPSLWTLQNQLSLELPEITKY